MDQGILRHGSDAPPRLPVREQSRLTPGVGWNGVREDLAPVITHADGTKEYRLSDHLASLRWRQIGATTETYDYTPWGGLRAGGPAGASERTFNENERDIESGEYSLGVRKYAEETGRFASVDALWESDRGMSGYVYAGANPLREVDPEGMQAEDIYDPQQPIGGGRGGSNRGVGVPSKTIQIDYYYKGKKLEKPLGKYVATRSQAHQEIKNRLGIPTSQQPKTEYYFSDSYGGAMRQYVYEANGKTMVVADHMTDPMHGPHFEGGQLKPDQQLTSHVARPLKYYGQRGEKPQVGYGVEFIVRSVISGGGGAGKYGVPEMEVDPGPR